MNPPAVSNGRAYSVAGLAKYMRVSPKRVCGWISTGELIGVNIGDQSCPRWRILPDDLERFLIARRSRPVPRRSRPRCNGHVTEFL